MCSCRKNVIIDIYVTRISLYNLKEYIFINREIYIDIYTCLYIYNTAKKNKHV